MVKDLARFKNLESFIFIASTSSEYDGDPQFPSPSFRWWEKLVRDLCQIMPRLVLVKVDSEGSPQYQDWKNFEYHIERKDDKDGVESCHLELIQLPDSRIQYMFEQSNF